MNKQYKKALFVFILLNVCLSSFALLNDSIVQIQADILDPVSHTIETAFGTGFFFEHTTEIITAYHVINNAERIQIFHKNKVYREVIVERIYPVYDMAVLSVADETINKNDTFLQGIFSENIDINYNSIGIVNGFVYTDPDPIVDKFTFLHEKMINSKKIRDSKGNEIFRKSIFLYRIKCLAYCGISGSPVIFNNRVIGLITGSINEGASMVWVVPIYYLNYDSITINKKCDKIDWPKLELYASLSKTRNLAISMLEKKSVFVHQISVDSSCNISWSLAGIEALENDFRNVQLKSGLSYLANNLNSHFIAGCRLNYIFSNYSQSYSIIDQMNDPINSIFHFANIDILAGISFFNYYKMYFSCGYCFPIASQNSFAIPLSLEINRSLKNHIDLIGILQAFTQFNLTEIQYNILGDAKTNNNTITFFNIGFGIRFNAYRF